MQLEIANQYLCVGEFVLVYRASSIEWAKTNRICRSWQTFINNRGVVRSNKSYFKHVRLNISNRNVQSSGDGKNNGNQKQSHTLGSKPFVLEIQRVFTNKMRIPIHLTFYCLPKLIKKDFCWFQVDSINCLLHGIWMKILDSPYTSDYVIHHLFYHGYTVDYFRGERLYKQHFNTLLEIAPHIVKILLFSREPCTKRTISEKKFQTCIS